MSPSKRLGLLPMTKAEQAAARAARSDAGDQLSLVDAPVAWEAHWWAMPSYTMRDARPMQQIIVNFHTWDDVAEFGRRLGVAVTRSTDTVWFPPETIGKPGEFEYADEE